MPTKTLKPFASPYCVPFDGSFRVADWPTAPEAGVLKKKLARKELEKNIDELSDMQRRLYAQDRYSLLLVFQAMDAAGKDSTIRAVMSGIDPAGCEVYSFKKPSSRELDHDFLWRTAVRLPERGRIGIFNRSYYEEVLVVRVHPGILDSQRLPFEQPLEDIWPQRYESIRDHEKHLACNGTVIVKFWLNVSREQQRQRFLSRIDNPEKHWKFSAADVRERQHWDRYMEAYEIALNETSRPWAPWYAIPADDKPFMRVTVSQIVLGTLKNMKLRYPRLSADHIAQLQEARRDLQD